MAGRTRCVDHAAELWLRWVRLLLGSRKWKRVGEPDRVLARTPVVAVVQQDTQEVVVVAGVVKVVHELNAVPQPVVDLVADCLERISPASCRP